MNIDWSRMVKPQKDAYDTEMLRKLAKSRQYTGPKRFQLMEPPADAPRIFGGQVALAHLRDDLRSPERYQHGNPEHPNFAIAETLLKRWPEAYEQFAQLMQIVHPMEDVMVKNKRQPRGSSSHSEGDKFWTMYTTYYDPIGLAQAYVHEMAHNKLRAMGIFIDWAQHMILNDPNDLYVSPIITTRKRPMTAVFHAQYSFMHVTALDVAMIEKEEDPAQLKILYFFLHRNLTRMEQGDKEIKKYIQLDRPGEVFVNHFYTWTQSVFEKAHRILEMAAPN
ncbi:MAG: HEXXH motif-containing putative peptide modification protein [Bacteroidota bacterium]